VRRHRFEAWAASFASWLVRPMPRRFALALGALLGRVLAALDRRHVGIAVDNLRRSFPDWSDDQLNATAGAVYRHFGRVVFDILWMQHRHPSEILALVEFDGQEHIEEPVAAGRGILYCTGHIGNWEIHAIAHAMLHGPVSVVARPLDNPELDRRLCAFRASSGNTIIYKKKALSQILRTIRSGGSVAMLLDQNVQAKDGIFVDFFGRKAATTTAAASLALKTGCALVPVHTELLVNGRYKLSYDRPVIWASVGNRDADIHALTQELARRTEAWIRRTPEQWLWMHRRWKTRPPSESAPPEAKAPAREATA
jgi:Kdo2-lipid IVA lauroyltransferase/acyltransferase